MGQVLNFNLISYIFSFFRNRILFVNLIRCPFVPSMIIYFSFFNFLLRSKISFVGRMLIELSERNKVFAEASPTYKQYPFQKTALNML
ncbi:hypothetical protein LEP1GSC016_2816 [Leptospira borgpetersenii serovar Hardjo-bovis str. Sponselee]|uniref:Uncharacterized protein n=1 Tax=Leptospira borgpetersenii serovar Hardjo-bovis str. Sponselee TaxID=1303729 RepID=M6BD80_LEPBO|nr:hypothetical protein LBHB_15895 [Leptospira borgpetersenii serovar Hardjo]EMJ77454.1 hypothetical protein LEP1GSC016_2816 [Leptospira borgpetersenii serovar Hardjo-bovis str. Sponselee]